MEIRWRAPAQAGALSRRVEPGGFAFPLARSLRIIDVLCQFGSDRAFMRRVHRVCKFRPRTTCPPLPLSRIGRPMRLVSVCARDVLRIRTILLGALPESGSRRGCGWGRGWWPGSKGCQSWEWGQVTRGDGDAYAGEGKPEVRGPPGGPAGGRAEPEWPEPCDGLWPGAPSPDPLGGGLGRVCETCDFDPASLVMICKRWEVALTGALSGFACDRNIPHASRADCPRLGGWGSHDGQGNGAGAVAAPRPCQPPQPPPCVPSVSTPSFQVPSAVVPLAYVTAP